METAYETAVRHFQNAAEQFKGSDNPGMEHLALGVAQLLIAYLSARQEKKEAMEEIADLAKRRFQP